MQNRRFVIVAGMIDLLVVEILIEVRAYEEKAFAILFDLVGEPKIVLSESRAGDNQN